MVLLNLGPTLYNILIGFLFALIVSSFCFHTAPLYSSANYRLEKSHLIFLSLSVIHRPFRCNRPEYTPGRFISGVKVEPCAGRAAPPADNLWAPPPTVVDHRAPPPPLPILCRRAADAIVAAELFCCNIPSLKKVLRKF